MPEAPDRIYIDEDDRKLLEKIDGDPEQLFSHDAGRSRKEQFLCFMAFGFRHGVKRPIEGKKDGLFLVKDLRPEDEALINAVAIYDSGSVDVLANISRVYETAEQYARGGMRLLLDSIESSQTGTFEKKLEKELYEIFSNIVDKQSGGVKLGE